MTKAAKIEKQKVRERKTNVLTKTRYGYYYCLYVFLYSCTKLRMIDLNMAGTKRNKIATRGSNSRGRAKKTGASIARRSTAKDKEEKQSKNDGVRRGEKNKKRTTYEVDFSDEDLSEDDSISTGRRHEIARTHTARNGPSEEDSISTGCRSKRAKTHMAQYSRPVDLVTERSKTVSSYSAESKRLEKVVEKVVNGTLSVQVSKSKDSKQCSVDKRVKNTVKTDIKRYLKDVWYKWTKFYIDSTKAEQHLRAGIVTGSLGAPASYNLTTDAYVIKYAPVIKSKLGELRRNSFQNVKARYDSK